MARVGALAVGIPGHTSRHPRCPIRVSRYAGFPRCGMGVGLFWMSGEPPWTNRAEGDRAVASSSMFGGPDLMVWLLLAFGGALFIGNVLALVRPPAKRAVRPPPRDAAKRRITEDDLKAVTLEKAPKARTISMAAVGFIVCIWAIASLVR